MTAPSTSVSAPSAAVPTPSTSKGSPSPDRRPPKRGGGTGSIARPTLANSAETYLGLGVVVIVSLLIIPLRPFILDAFLALSMAISIVVLLVTLSTREPIEFSIFPSMLLLITLFRLGLNVSSTRLILGTGEAGQVISAFGDFVIGGNYVVGLVIFLILVIINFVVITKGAGRVAEVAARFTLDAMPGRQMSIDADLGAGLIDETEARRRREEINSYADFYGAMDGAAKFVRGDAIAGLVITVINLLGGFTIGIAQRGMSAADALATYSSLSVGDGLVTQIPALIVSTAAGILVTYSSSSATMAPALADQLTRNPRTIWVASGILGAFALVPGLPALPFVALAGAGAALARSVGRKQEEARDQADAAADEFEADTETPIHDLLAVEPLEVEVGYGLVPMVNDGQERNLLTRIGLMRKQLALELGVVVPPARIRDNMQLASGEYVIKLRGVRVAGAELLPNQLLALHPPSETPAIDGVQANDPTFNLPATWVTSDARSQAEAAGCRVVDPQTVFATHLMEVIRRHAADLLSLQGTKELIDRLKDSHPALVEDVIPNKLPLSVVHRVLQRLLRERLPVRDLVSVLEALSDAAEQTKDPEQLVEHVRRALSAVIVDCFKDEDGVIRGITVGPRLEAALIRLLNPRSAGDDGLALDAEELSAVLQELRSLTDQTKRKGELVPLIAPPSLRIGIRRLVEPVLPQLPIVSLGELPTHAPIQSLVTWEVNRAA